MNQRSSFPLSLTRMSIIVSFSFMASSGLCREYIRIVGSSAMYPFASVAAEHYGITHKAKTPVVEATGTGGGIKVFCSGVGPQFPDIVTASRPMTVTERRLCARHGATSLIELTVGKDGIVLVASQKGPAFKLTRVDLYRALGVEIGKEKNASQMWSDINLSFPPQPIFVLGPPSTAGTREIFEEQAMLAGCRQSASSHKCSSAIRTDGPYVEASDFENVIVQKVRRNPKAIGVVSYSVFDQNRATLRALSIDGVAPSQETIASGRYPIARPLYLYVKRAHMAFIPGIKTFVQEFLSDKAVGMEGYVTDKGLIPLDDHERQRQQRKLK